MRTLKQKKQPETFYQEIVKTYVTRTYGCTTVRELDIGGAEFDVVGFSPDRGEFYIVECKRTGSPVGVGKTFGQILAYKAMIVGAGERFLSAFEQASAKVRRGATSAFWPHTARFLAAGSIPVRFYVALTEKACARLDILRLIKGDLKDVGIIRINRDNRCRDYIRISGEKDYNFCKACLVSVPIQPPGSAELEGVFRDRNVTRDLRMLATALDGKIKGLATGITSVRHGGSGVFYRLSHNFVGMRVREKYLSVKLKEAKGWSSTTVLETADLKGLTSRIKKALARTIPKAR